MKTPSKQKDTRRTLGAAGARVTNQRRLILEIIRTGEDHLDADEIYRRARRKYPRLSLSTVYRNLQLFKKLDLVDEVHLDEEQHHYEIKPPAEHYHLVCLGCGRITEFGYPLPSHLKRVPEVKGFEIITTEMRVSGYCSQCRQKEKDSHND